VQAKEALLSHRTRWLLEVPNAPTPAMPVVKRVSQGFVAVRICVRTVAGRVPLMGGEMNTHVYLKIFVALCVLVNPLEGLPVFLARTQSLEPRARLTIARTAALAVICIMLVALVVGRGLLQLFNISIGDLTTAGGVIIFLIALKMVLGPSGKANSSSPLSPEEFRSFGIVPLATPLLAGPGVISAVIVYASEGPAGQGNTPLDYVILSGIIVVVGVATGIALRAATPLKRMLGETGIDVSTRVSGIFVAAIATGMIVQGLKQCFQILAH
jgi:multiple antibiotic resistance protein